MFHFTFKHLHLTEFFLSVRVWVFEFLLKPLLPQ